MPHPVENKTRAIVRLRRIYAQADSLMQMIEAEKGSNEVLQELLTMRSIIQYFDDRRFGGAFIGVVRACGLYAREC